MKEVVKIVIVIIVIKDLKNKFPSRTLYINIY